MFVHGGILPEHAAYGLERLNADCRAWMEGAPDAPMPAFLGGRRAVVWARDYSNGDPLLSHRDKRLQFTCWCGREVFI